MAMYTNCFDQVSMMSIIDGNKLGEDNSVRDVATVHAQGSIVSPGHNDFDTVRL